MHLQFEPSEAQRAAAALAPDEAVLYASPYDLSLEGDFCDGFAFFTPTRGIFLDGGLRREIAWSSCRALRSEGYVGCGALVADTEQGQQILIRFSLRHTDRFSEIVGRLNAARLGRPVSVKQGLKERYCIRCGAPLVGGACASCANRRLNLERFWDLCRPYLFRIILISSLMLVGTFCTLYRQQVIKIVLRDFLKAAEGTFAQILPYFWLMLGLGLLSILASVGRKTLCVRLGARMSMDLRQKVFDKIQTLSMSFLNRSKAGELMNRVTHDTVAIRDFMEQGFGNAVSTLVTMIGAAVLMFVLNAKLAALAIAFTPMVLVLSRIFNRKMRVLFRTQTRKNDQIKTRLQDVISGIRVVKSFGREASEAEQFNRYSTDLAVTNSRNEVFWAIFFPLLTLLMGLGTYFVNFFGGVDVLGGRMPVEELIQFTAYTALLYSPLRWMANMPRMVMRMLNAMDRIYTVLDEIPEIADAPDAQPHAIQGHVTFENVSFGYTSCETVLDDISFSVEPGEMIGLVGASGVGKSSLINLLMRLYDVDSGRILLDGVDIRSLPTRDLHRQIGVVLQENFLFSGTVLDNIRYSAPDASYEDVIRAAKMANAHDFICTMPDGYNTYIGDKGYTVSGGERQRIAIARAILSNPRLLILDEATSALDTESEELVQQAIERLTKGRTTFAIAHRLSTLRNATRIFVLDDHKLAEVGTHEELMRRKGIYYGLITAQSKLHRVPKA